MSKRKLKKTRNKKKFKRNPWSAKTAHRHNKKCGSKTKCAKKWAKIANAVLRKTGNEASAIRIANWQVKRMGLKSKRKARRNKKR